MKEERVKRLAVSLVREAVKAMQEAVKSGATGLAVVLAAYQAVYAAVVEAELWLAMRVLPAGEAKAKRIFVQLPALEASFLGLAASAAGCSRQALLRAALQAAAGSEPLPVVVLPPLAFKRLEAEASELGCHELTSRRGRLALLVACRCFKVLKAGRPSREQWQGLAAVVLQGLECEQLPVKLYSEPRRAMEKLLLSLSEEEGEALVSLAAEAGKSRQAVLRSLVSRQVAAAWEKEEAFKALLRAELA